MINLRLLLEISLVWLRRAGHVKYEYLLTNGRLSVDLHLLYTASSCVMCIVLSELSPNGVL